jgi:hypothetical protein
MFGPDSSKDGFKNLPIVVDKFTSTSKHYAFWKTFFKKQGLQVIELTAKEHDKKAARSQGVTHFIGRLLDKFNLQSTPIDTSGAKLLQNVREQTCNDTWQLFMDLQNYNPYTKSMRIDFGKAYDKIYSKLLPARISPKSITFGIQGGIGSFNEEAILFYLKNNGIKNYKIKYLYTTEKVLRQLHKGNIDYGLFAIQNSVGGMVEESITAMARYKFIIKEELQIKIKHFLMKRKDVGKEEVKIIMAHPQVLKQCKSTLGKKFSYYELQSGKGDLLDTAKAAEALYKGTIPKTTAVLGPKGLSELYALEIIAENLQDDKTNFTDFLLVERTNI